MDFVRPILLVHLLWFVPLGVAFFLLISIRRRSILARFGELGILQRLQINPSKIFYRASCFLILLSCVSMLLAASGPLFGSRLKTLRRQGVNVMIALDVSTSMLADDVKPNRLEKAKREVSLLLDGLQGDRVGIIAFAGTSFLQCPLTLDYGTAKMLLGLVGPGTVSAQGTNIADAIERSIKALEKVGRSHRVLLLITDGEDHSGRLDEAISLAREAEIRIFTIGIGSVQGVPIPDLDEEGRFRGHKKDARGHVVMSRMNEEALQRIALETRGMYFRSSAGSIQVGNILKRIEEMDKEELDARDILHKEDRYQIPLAMAFFLLLVEIPISTRRNRGRL